MANQYNDKSIILYQNQRFLRKLQRHCLKIGARLGYSKLERH